MPIRHCSKPRARVFIRRTEGLARAKPPLRFAVLVSVVVVCGCVGTRPQSPVPTPTVAWPERVQTLQQAAEWRVQARAAAAVGTQGWQASLTWTQHGSDSELHLSGPLGMGASVLRLTSAGLSLNDAPPSPDAVARLQDQLGFDLPMQALRYWLLGVPDPGSASEVTRNRSDRAQTLSQEGWTIDYDRYQAVRGDLLPAHLVLHRDAVRVRVAVDRWDLTP